MIKNIRNTLNGRWSIGMIKDDIPSDILRNAAEGVGRLFPKIKI